MESWYFLLILKGKLIRVKSSDYKEHSLAPYKMTNSSDVYVFARSECRETAMRDK